MADEPRTANDSRWRDRAVDRSLNSAREEALSRSSRFIVAARELLEETGRLDFTVQEIVERSNLSLRSFYKHFAGKDELLLGLFEELITDFVEELRREVEQEDDPVLQLRAFVVGSHRRALRAQTESGRSVAAFYLSMFDRDEAGFAGALRPQVELLEAIVARGASSGRLRDDIDVFPLTLLVTMAMASAAQMTVLGIRLGGNGISVEELWAWCGQAALPAGATVPSVSA